MTGAGWLQLAALIALVVAVAPFLGAYLARVFGGGPAPGDRAFAPLERLTYRVLRVDPDSEQPWNVYAFTSAGNNNGSAFGGLDAATNWYNATTGLAMLAGRFLLIVPVLAIAGALARKQPIPPSPGTFPTGTPLFSGLLVGVILIVVGLTFFPVVALGPLVEQLAR